LANFASGVHSGALPAVSGAALTSLTAANLVGNIPTASLDIGDATNFIRGDGVASNTLTSNIASSYDALTLTNSDTSGSSNVRLNWTHGSGTTALASLTNGGFSLIGNNFAFGTGTAQGSNWLTNNIARISVSSGGNITANAAASGVTFSVTAFAGSAGITVSATSTNAILSLNNTTSGNAYTDYVTSGVRQFLVGVHRANDEFRIVSGSDISTTAPTLAVTAAGTYRWLQAAATRFVPGATSFSLRNNGDSADNLLLEDAGQATFRGAIRGQDTTNAYLLKRTSTNTGLFVETSGNLSGFMGGNRIWEISAATLNVYQTGSTPALTVNGGAYTITNTQSFSATPTFNAALSNVFEMGALTGNVTSMTVSNPSNGQTINIRLIQDATGSRTVAHPTSSKIAGNMGVTASAASILSITYSAANTRWEGAWINLPA
jgi:hypothetical protein